MTLTTLLCHIFCLYLANLGIYIILPYLPRLLSPDEIKEYCGLIRTDDLLGGLWVPGLYSFLLINDESSWIVIYE